MLTTQTAIEGFLKSSGIPFLRDAQLSTCSTWRIGGPADYLVEPSTGEQVCELIRFARQRGSPLVVIGRGSNLLFGDEGVRGIVLKLGRSFSKMSIVGAKVTAQSGIFVPRLVHNTSLAGLSGIEHAAGIPGTLGGLVAMNGGSQRQSISEVVEWVRFLDNEGNTATYNRDQCRFAHRHSIFLETPTIIVEVGLGLTPAEAKVVRRAIVRILQTRRKKFPLHLPNCGSVFKSLPGQFDRFGPPGAIIDKLALKGLSVGDASVSERHGNFIVNKGAAKASDVLRLIDVVRDAVRRQTGIVLESEVRLVHATGMVTFV